MCVYLEGFRIRKIRKICSLVVLPIFDTILSSVGDPQEFAIADPCPYHVKYSPDIFQKQTDILTTYNYNFN